MNADIIAAILSYDKDNPTDEIYCNQEEIIIAYDAQTNIIIIGFPSYDAPYFVEKITTNKLLSDIIYHLVITLPTSLTYISPSCIRNWDLYGISPTTFLKAYCLSYDRTRKEGTFVIFWRIIMDEKTSEYLIPFILKGEAIPCPKCGEVPKRWDVSCVSCTDDDNEENWGGSCWHCEKFPMTIKPDTNRGDIPRKAHCPLCHKVTMVIIEDNIAYILEE